MLYITPSLYSSWYWYTEATGDKEEQAKLDFENALNKVKSEPTEAMQDGIDYENKIRKLAEHLGGINPITDVPYEELLKQYDDVDIQIAELLKNGIWQQNIIQKTLRLPLELCLPGNAVAFKGVMDTLDIYNGIIYDLKKTKNFRRSQYDYSIQHLVYMYCSELYKFRYIIRTPNQKDFLLTDDYFLSPDEVEIELREKLCLFFTSIMRNPEWKNALYLWWNI